VSLYGLNFLDSSDVSVIVHIDGVEERLTSSLTTYLDRFSELYYQIFPHLSLLFDDDLDVVRLLVKKESMSIKESVEKSPGSTELKLFLEIEDLVSGSRELLELGDRALLLIQVGYSNPWEFQWRGSLLVLCTAIALSGGVIEIPPHKATNFPGIRAEVHGLADAIGKVSKALESDSNHIPRHLIETARILEDYMKEREQEQAPSLSRDANEN